MYTAAVDGVDPIRLTAACVSRDALDSVVAHAGLELLRCRGGVIVVGAGKAAAKMAAGCEQRLGERVIGGAVVVADGCAVPLSSVVAFEASHPVPDARGLRTTKLIGEWVASSAVPVLCVISGGASSLLVAPRPPLTLADKQAVSGLLLKCGAAIGEMNTVRKHLSTVKGGGLARRGKTPMVSLILSDVVGDDPAVIGSGPTVVDDSTFADALAILRRYEIEHQVPVPVRELLTRGARGEVPETLKAGDADSQRVRNVVIGSNRVALQAAAAAARQLGLRPHVLPVPLEGETVPVARQWAEVVKATLVEARESIDCCIAGGETTVVVTGTGRGGRNQEFALAMATPLASTDVCVLSAGTDGIDGPTDAAGAFVDGSTLARSRAQALDAESALANNDSYGFFTAFGDLFRPGPTGTNVMDIKIAVRVPSSA